MTRNGERDGFLDEATSAGTLADTVAAAVLAVPGVVALHMGTFGEVATYLPGRSVIGIRIRDEEIEVHVVLEWGSPVLATADAIRAVVVPLVARRVDVVIQDVVDSAAAVSQLNRH